MQGKIRLVLGNNEGLTTLCIPLDDRVDEGVKLRAWYKLEDPSSSANISLLLLLQYSHLLRVLKVRSGLHFPDDDAIVGGLNAAVDGHFGHETAILIPLVNHGIPGSSSFHTSRDSPSLGIGRSGYVAS